MIRKKKNRAIGITSFCNTEEKLNVLIVNISQLRSFFPDYDIVLHANHPLDVHIQKLVDVYIYEDLNHTEEKKWIYYWDIISDGKDTRYFDKKFYYSIQDTGYSVFQQIQSLTEYLVDYEWVMLINYDTAVEEIRIENYSTEHTLTAHWFPDHKAYSLIMLFFDPKEFRKVTDLFYYENWVSRIRDEQLNEERFLDIVMDSGISVKALDYKVSDRVSGEPDYRTPNAPPNPFFDYYLLCQQEGKIELYLWGLKQKIHSVFGHTDDGECYKFENQNKNGAFHCTEYLINGKIKSFFIATINQGHGPLLGFELKVKKGYVTEPIEKIWNYK